MDTPSDQKKENINNGTQVPAAPVDTSTTTDVSSENAMSKPDENLGAVSEPASDQEKTTGSMTTENSTVTPDVSSTDEKAASATSAETATSEPTPSVSTPTGSVGSESPIPQNPAAIPAVPDAEKMSTDTTQAPVEHKGSSKLIIGGVVVFVLVLAGVIVYLGNQMRVSQAKQAAHVVSTQSVVTPAVAPTQAPGVKATDPVSDPSEDLNSLNQDLNQL